LQTKSKVSSISYAICSVAAAPVRKEPSHRSEMVNQLLFGDTMQVLEEKDEWKRIKTIYDGYEGWLTYHLVSEINEKLATTQTDYFASAITNPITLTDQLITAPMGSALTGFDQENRLLWDPVYKFHGTYRKVSAGFNEEMLIKLIYQWINAPYLWGGKTYMGVDCSGFVQTIYKVLGIQLKRDAWQQQEQCTGFLEPEEAVTGDLAFFSNDANRVIHVGIILPQHQIVHASGKVRIDKLTKGGIINVDTNKQSHKLHSIRKVNP
jgi:Cell wall-associated hydrolases (invasion-associated proteins)